MEYGHTDGPVSGVPEEIIDTYMLDPDHVTALKGGSINKTLLAEQDGERIVLQQLGPMFDERVINDFQIVTDHLRNREWHVPEVVGTADSRLSVRDAEGRLWRAMSYIDADPLPTVPPSDPQFCRLVGGMVARLHADLSELDYEPQFKIDNFHDTDHHAEKLQATMPRPDPEMRFLAADVLSTYYDKTGMPEDGCDRLLHGDPKLGNMLFRNGRPYTLIDFDTVMKGSVWVDIGDMLRSYSTQPWVGEQSLQHVIEGYYDGTDTHMTLRFFARAAQQARKSLTCELAMRHLNDIVDDIYFEWDPDMYESRQAYNTARAKVQWSRLQDMKV